VNVIGAKTLLGKEVRRFMRVPGQTILQPLISTTLYFVVFGYTLGGRQASIEGVSYVQYIVPGLVFLGVANNAFLNS
jgi:ABC-2 type transport system permease protein